MGTKLKVLMVGPSRDAQGGITSVINGYYEAGLQNLCNLTFVGTTSNGNALAKGAAALRALHRFGQLLPECDLVHIHLGGGISIYREELFADKAIRAGKPVIAHVHMSHEYLFRRRSSTYKNKYRHLLGRADRVVVLSEKDRSFYIEQHICRPEQIVVLHNAIRVPVQSSFNAASTQVTFLGQVGQRKGTDVLIHAIPQVHAAVPKAVFVFAGDGDSAPYEDLARTLGVASSCHFVGWVGSVQREQLFRDTYVFVQPSRDEGMSMSLLESMARGIPVVATNVGGTSSVVRDGVDGLLIPSTDSKALAEGIIRLFTDKEYAQRMSGNARRRIKTQFDILSIPHKLISLYKEVTEQE